MHTRQWDVGGDSFDSLGALMVLAFSKWLTSPLDEPELQAVSFGLGDLWHDIVDENETNEETGT